MQEQDKISFETDSIFILFLVIQDLKLLNILKRSGDTLFSHLTVKTDVPIYYLLHIFKLF